MAGPWERYRTAAPATRTEGPWSRYQNEESTTPARAASVPTPAQLENQRRRRAMTPQQRAEELDREHAAFQTAGERLAQGDWGELKNYVDALQHRTLDAVGGLAQTGGHAVQALTDYLPKDSRVRQRVAADNARLDESLAARERDYQLRTTGSVAANVGGALGSVLPYLVPARALQGVGTRVAGAVLPKAAGVLPRAMISGGTQGALSTLAAPVTDGNYASGKVRQLAAGTAFGALAPVVARAAAPIIGKAINTAKGIVDPATKQLQELGERYGVRLSVGDITQKALPRKAEVALESVPIVGTSGFRAAQQTEASAAAHGVADRIRDEMIDTGFKSVAQVDQAAARGNKAAIALKHELANAGDDWNKIMQVSGNLQAFRAKLIADKLYGQVEHLAKGAGDVPASATIKALDEVIAEASTAHLPEEATIRMLQNLQASLSGRTKAVTNPLMAGSGGAQQSIRVTNNTYADMRRLRSDLGSLVKDYYKGSNAVTGSKGVGLLEKVKSAVERDMEDFATSTKLPELTQAWRRADKFYRQKYVPFKEQQLAKALTGADVDEIYSKFIQAGKGDRANRFYNALDSKGQAAVRYGMISNAMDKAVDETRNVFSPARFAQELERVREAQGAFFRGQSRREIDGFAKLMRHIERAGQYAENPPTGQRTIPWMLGGAAVFNAPLAAKVAAFSGVTRAMLTTAPGKRFLLAASSLDQGSPMMAKLLQRIERTMPKFAGAVEGPSGDGEAPLNIEITGGTLGEAPTEEEVERLRAGN